MGDRRDLWLFAVYVCVCEGGWWEKGPCLHELKWEDTHTGWDHALVGVLENIIGEREVSICTLFLTVDAVYQLLQTPTNLVLQNKEPFLELWDRRNSFPWSYLCQEGLCQQQKEQVRQPLGGNFHTPLFWFVSTFNRYWKSITFLIFVKISCAIVWVIGSFMCTCWSQETYSYPLIDVQEVPTWIFIAFFFWVQHLADVRKLRFNEKAKELRCRSKY